MAGLARPLPESPARLQDIDDFRSMSFFDGLPDEYCFYIQHIAPMEFRRWHNMVYATLDERATFDQVGIVTSKGIEYSLWLGVADRRIVRRLPDARGVLLDIESWRGMILEKYNRLGPGVYMVGAVIANIGVVGVMDGRKPLLKVIEPERDRLNRNVIE